MFESAELGHEIDKETYRRERPALREALLAAQFEAQESAQFPVIILIGGVDGAGKGETLNRLNAWMDPRLIETHGMDLPTPEEQGFPPMWRFWRALPPKGKIGIFVGSWYTKPILDRVLGAAGEAQLDQSIDDINRFERMLADEGALILKFWLHLSKKAQKKRLDFLEKNPRTAWRVTDDDWRRFKRYDEFRDTSEHVLRRTSKGHAPWIVVEGADARYRQLTVGTTIVTALRDRLDRAEDEATSRLAPPAPAITDLNVINSLDLTQELGEKDYARRLEDRKGRLNALSRDRKFRDRAVVAVFEGNDAAGKGGAIRRVTAALDARQYRVVRSASPTDEEGARPYLWRFWRHVPRHGHFTIFDRSWYGRVLVERVEGFAAPADWMRAYGEINDFEAEMVRHGIVVVKFWLAISRREQLRRYEARRETGYKRFKLTDEDWRNRERWDEYVRAVSDMVDRTSTEIAPWTLVEAEDKRFARIRVLETLCDRLEDAL